ncbi:MAG: 2-hydroxymethylglutarate dehydrogenase [Syntrophobacterales bacterium RBG_19FT_COMBO_59_10]|nr:MAG: 2-hydroxymethylglutarate dehydrogenase [Syntrophobacterales bacterium RBG_19FT_COMBO_59_10]
MTEKIGFIGLGAMGKWMALNLLKAGFQTRVYDINSEAVGFLEGQGATSTKSPAETAAQVDWLFLSLPDTSVVETVIFGKNGVAQGAKPGLAVIDLSTISYLPTLEIHRRLKEKGIIFADAPVSGMETRAKEGTLTVMFGGDEGLFQKVRPALEVIGKEVVHMGAVGSGQLTKLINQLLYNISAAGLAEVLPMAVKLGLDPERVARVVTTGTGRSFAAEYFIPLTLENKFREGYPVKSAYKDMISAAEISARKNIPLPLVNAATMTFQMAIAEGFGDLSKGGLIRVFERMLGVEFRKKSGS